MPPGRRRYTRTLIIRLHAAGGRNNAVHAQIFDHLPVVVEAVAHSPRGQCQPGRITFTEGLFTGATRFFSLTLAAAL